MNRLQNVGLLAISLLCGWIAAADAAEFVINPLRVDLDRNRKAGEFAVRNEGTEPLRMQLQAMSWKQDAQGKDLYEPDESLIFFPRTMEIPPGGSRVVRLGVKATPATREDAYRLFVEELPGSTPAPAAPGASLKILLRVGVAVFVAPAQPETAAAISGLEMQGGQIAWTVANTGNVHFRADQIELSGRTRDGAELFVDKVDDRYFLAGTTKQLRFRVPPELCGRLASVEARVAAEKVDLKRGIDVDSSRCR
jgi:fimbrial chaperone protein